jgi:hypothetical protein
VPLATALVKKDCSSRLSDLAMKDQTMVSIALSLSLLTNVKKKLLLVCSNVINGVDLYYVC